MSGAVRVTLGEIFWRVSSKTLYIVRSHWGILPYELSKTVQVFSDEFLLCGDLQFEAFQSLHLLQPINTGVELQLQDLRQPHHGNENPQALMHLSDWCDIQSLEELLAL
jgi:hypothetical protein